MKVLDPGHRYSLATLDRSDWPEDANPQLIFVKRIGDNYPGNEPPGHEGTTTQEVIRALINRTKYVDNQIHSDHNNFVIHHLREALFHLEHRAAQVRKEWSAFYEATKEARMLMHFPETKAKLQAIEDIPICDTCGHIACGKHT
jgi:hypothetical protein